MSSKLELRKNPEAARAFSIKLFPDKVARKAVLDVFANAVIFAHALSPDKWGVSLLDQFIRLNLGGIEVLTLARETLHLVLFRPKLPAELRELVTGDGYRKVPQSCFLDVDYLESARTWDLAKPPWRELARRASETPRHSMTRKAHSPGVLDFLRREGWKEVPNPLWAA